MIAPPAPPWRLDMRLTACLAQLIAPITLTANMRCQRSARISSKRMVRSTMPALLTSASSLPSFSVDGAEHCLHLALHPQHRVGFVRRDRAATGLDDLVGQRLERRYGFARS